MICGSFAHSLFIALYKSSSCFFLESVRLLSCFSLAISRKILFGAEPIIDTISFVTFKICHNCRLTAGEAYKSLTVLYVIFVSPPITLRFSICSKKPCDWLNNCIRLSSVSHKAVIIFCSWSVSFTTIFSKNALESLPQPEYDSEATVLICFSVKFGYILLIRCFNNFLSAPNNITSKTMRSLSSVLRSTPLNFSLKS